MKSAFKFKAVLFDLDGTLIDTAPDLAAALNHVLLSENKPILPLSEIRTVASDGVRGLLALGLNIQSSHKKYAEFQTMLLDYYAHHIARYSRLFSGLDAILQDLEKNHIPWGIVTNKPTYLTEKLLKQLKLDQRAACVVCGDTLSVRKPDPAPLQYAAQLLNLASQDCCYIGDAERDIIAAKSANMFSITALYGYIHKDINPKLWQADAYIYSPKQLLNFL